MNLENPLPQAAVLQPDQTEPFADWPDIYEVTFGCQANMGRSILAQLITEKAMAEGVIPKFFVNSGSLSGGYAGRYSGFHPLTEQEVSRVKGRALYSWEGAGYRSKPLRACHISERTDLILFVPGREIRSLLPDQMKGDVPRSIICTPLDDPSNPREDIAPAEAMMRLTARLAHLIHDELKGIMTKVRSGAYIRDHSHYRDGIYYPFGVDEKEFKKQIHEVWFP